MQHSHGYPYSQQQFLSKAGNRLLLQHCLSAETCVCFVCFVCSILHFVIPRRQKGKNKYSHCSYCIVFKQCYFLRCYLMKPNCGHRQSYPAVFSGIPKISCRNCSFFVCLRQGRQKSSVLQLTSPRTRSKCHMMTDHITSLVPWATRMPLVSFSRQPKLKVGKPGPEEQ